MDKIITVALVDDHALLRNALATLVTNLGYEVLYERSNGKEFIENVDESNLPDLVIMDINMPEMNGFETTLWLQKNHPSVNVIALSMYDDENSIIRMIRNGAKGYILKDASPGELKLAIDSVVLKGFYYSDLVSGRILHNILKDDQTGDKAKHVVGLSEKNIEFLKLVCTEMTYKEIASEMHLSPRTIDGYRDELFKELDIKSRVGLVLFAIKNGIVHFN